ncbi:2-oxo acid dehydrogenase subunit E2 [Streptomyces malaysiense]|uniref:Acyltransferase n=1 Tax=Streptomyces malaysiense TaxID=1428626 RepID=A0A1J4Q6C6_9ACTN|nr:2-oxo acid dehydrogenase subunit E2 [Streptomyces malaysiense]OIK28717.1 acyltransferase [Streptomyces malaysiense]
MNPTPVSRSRRHTLFFLDAVRRFAPVHLDTEVDMTAVRGHRRAARARGGPRYSTAAYVLHAAGRVLARHPEANAALGGRLWPRIARFPHVNGKLTLDKTLDGQRVVLSTVVPGLQRATLQEIQRHLEQFRDGDPDTMPEFERLRRLHRAPLLIGSTAFRLAAGRLRGRDRLMGTVAVTSLGHRPVDGFHSVGGTTTTLGLGRTVDRPVVRDGRVTVAPVMRLSLTFDHRVIDGAEAADVLGELKEHLEEFRTDAADEPPTTPPAAAVPEEVS